jgi:hypothetical protein
VLESAPQDTKDTQHHVGDDEHDDDYGGVFDEGRSDDPAASLSAGRRLPSLVLELVEVSSPAAHATSQSLSRIALPIINQQTLQFHHRLYGSTLRLNRQ